MYHLKRCIQCNDILDALLEYNLKKHKRKSDSLRYMQIVPMNN